MGDTRDRVGNAGVIVAGGAFKIALYVCIVVLIIWLGRLSYQFGHDIFDQQPMSPGEGQEITVVVKEDDSVYDIAKTLESKGLVERIQSKDNKKHIEIALLDQAEIIIEAGLNAQKQFAQNVLRGLTEEETRLCIRVFDKICNNAEEQLKNDKENES